MHTVGNVSLQFGAGGILGQAFGQLLYHWIGYDGATLVSLAAFLLAITLLAQIHWSQLLEYIGERAEFISLKVANALKRGEDKDDNEQAESKKSTKKDKSRKLNAAKALDEDELDKPAIFRKKQRSDMPSNDSEQVDEVPSSSFWYTIKSLSLIHI